jgi:hypothetical protein
MRDYSRVAVERAMKIQEIILRTIAKKIMWLQAAQIIGISPRHAWLMPSPKGVLKRLTTWRSRRLLGKVLGRGPPRLSSGWL